MEKIDTKRSRFLNEVATRLLEKSLYALKNQIPLKGEFEDVRIYDDIGNDIMAQKDIFTYHMEFQIWIHQYHKNPDDRFFCVGVGLESAFIHGAIEIGDSNRLIELFEHRNYSGSVANCFLDFIDRLEDKAMDHGWEGINNKLGII